MTVSEIVQQQKVTVETLLAVTGLDKKVLRAILEGRYTPSPQQRQRLADALQVSPDEVEWGHVNEVSNLYGHGPQFGRTP